jgi:hypothetical protein
MYTRKKKIEMQMKAIIAEIAEVLLVLMAVPMMATRNWQVSIPRAPYIRSGRRPKRSMVRKEIGGRENVYECGDERDQEQVLDRTKLDEEAGTELVDDRPGKLNFMRP